MPTTFSHSKAIVRAGLLCASVALLIGAAWLVLFGVSFASSHSRTPQTTDDAIDRVLTLAAWRMSPDVVDAVAQAGDLNQLPVSLPTVPLALPERPAQSDADRQWDPAARYDFLALSLAQEIQECARIVDYVDARNLLVDERDKLLAAHNRRVEMLAQRFPSIRVSPIRFASELAGELANLEVRLQRVTVRTGLNGSQPGLEHWGPDLDYVRDRLREASTLTEPYSATLAAEYAVDRIGRVTAQLDSMPIGPSPFVVSPERLTRIRDLQEQLTRLHKGQN